jgi:glycosyltransferase involved in cell wall biosynthesis
MGKRGRQAILQTYTWAREAEKLLELYRRLIGAPSEFWR